MDCEDGIVTDFLTTVAKKSENKFCQMFKANREFFPFNI